MSRIRNTVKTLEHETTLKNIIRRTLFLFLKRNALSTQHKRLAHIFDQLSEHYLLSVCVRATQASIMTVLVYHATALGSLCRSLSEQILQYKTTNTSEYGKYPNYPTTFTRSFSSSNLVRWIRNGFFRPFSTIHIRIRPPIPP
jgi:hypothetical protein